MSLLPSVCAYCHAPIGEPDSAFCETHWHRLGSETRRSIVGARNGARESGRPTKALPHAVRRGQRELSVADSLGASLSSDKGA
jgi:hypothetical protein